MQDSSNPCTLQITAGTSAVMDVYTSLGSPALVTGVGSFSTSGPGSYEINVYPSSAGATVNADFAVAAPR